MVFVRDIYHLISTCYVQAPSLLIMLINMFLAFGSKIEDPMKFYDGQVSLAMKMCWLCSCDMKMCWLCSCDMKMCWLCSCDMKMCCSGVFRWGRGGRAPYPRA